MNVLLTGIALLLAATLAGCSQATPDAAGAATTSPAHQADTRSTGARVDSLNGIPGHHFGDPLRAFPGLIAAASEPGDLKRYYYSSSQPAVGTGWFARHDQDFAVTYFFVDDKFATIVITAYGDYRKLLRDEAGYLFGRGNRYELDGTIWKGRQAYATYVNTFTPQGPAARLEIGSEPLAAAQKQHEASRLKADNELN